MSFRRRIQEAPRVDLTPMIDVVFLLLIFFMISTTFIEQPGLNIDLPVSDSRQLKHTPKEVQVYLTAAGEIYLQREKVTAAELQQHLAGYDPVRAGEMTFLLMADKSVQHGAVIQLMDMARSAGIGHLAIATDTEGAGK